MAGRFVELFTTTLMPKHIERQAISSHVSFRDCRYFITTLPAQFTNSRSILARVFFLEKTYEDCRLNFYVNISSVKFRLHLVNLFDFLNMRVNRPLTATFRWNLQVLEIYLQHSISPQMQVELNDAPANFVERTATKLTNTDIILKCVLVNMIDITHFHDSCTEEIKTTINEGKPFSVAIFPPGLLQSFPADMCFDRGGDYRTVLILLHNYLAFREQDPPKFLEGVELRIWYRVQFGKIQLALTTNQYPPLPLRIIYFFYLFISKV